MIDKMKKLISILCVFNCEVLGKITWSIFYLSQKFCVMTFEDEDTDGKSIKGWSVKLLKIIIVEYYF